MRSAKVATPKKMFSGEERKLCGDLSKKLLPVAKALDQLADPKYKTRSICNLEEFEMLVVAIEAEFKENKETAKLLKQLGKAKELAGQLKDDLNLHWLNLLDLRKAYQGNMLFHLEEESGVLQAATLPGFLGSHAA